MNTNALARFRKAVSVNKQIVEDMLCRFPTPQQGVAA